jgi:hypothetical protein
LFFNIDPSQPLPIGRQAPLIKGRSLLVYVFFIPYSLLLIICFYFLAPSQMGRLFNLLNLACVFNPFSNWASANDGAGMGNINIIYNIFNKKLWIFSNETMEQ